MATTAKAVAVFLVWHVYADVLLLFAADQLLLFHAERALQLHKMQNGSTITVTSAGANFEISTDGAAGLEEKV